MENGILNNIQINLKIGMVYGLLKIQFVFKMFRLIEFLELWLNSVKLIESHKLEIVSL